MTSQLDVYSLYFSVDIIHFAHVEYMIWFSDFWIENKDGAICTNMSRLCLTSCGLNVLPQDKSKHHQNCCVFYLPHNKLQHIVYIPEI